MFGPNWLCKDCGSKFSAPLPMVRCPTCGGKRMVRLNPLTKQEMENIRVMANQQYAIAMRYSNRPTMSEFYRGRAVGMGKIAKQFNPKEGVMARCPICNSPLRMIG